MSSLTDLCTIANVQAALPSILGLELDSTSVTANAITTNVTATDYCNVTMAYSHAGKDDRVVLWYTLPDPSTFKNRFYIPGGGGYSISQAEPTGGLAYGAVSGSTDVGYDGWSVNLDAVVLAANGSVNWDHVKMFSYQAQGETNLVGKALTKTFYGLSETDKVYAYFEGCSDGGREAMSQAQRYGAEYDGIVAGAPAFRHAHQQINHLTAVVTEQTMGYYPPPCEVDAIINATVAACDPLDGRTDGVVSRTDLCKLNFNTSSVVGTPYSCAATSSSSLGFGFGKRSTLLPRAAGQSVTSYVPAQEGNVTEEGAALVAQLWDGLFSVDGQRAYFPWPIGAALDEAAPTWSNDTESWTPTIPDTGGLFAVKMVQLLELDNLPDIDNVTYDTLINWMNIGYRRFADSLQTGFTDLSEFQTNGGKLLHYHGESDNSIPPASSVHYHEAVRALTFPEMELTQSTAALDEFYRFFLVPGAAHCHAGDGPYPTDLLQTTIDWVESGIAPDTLNSSVAATGEIQLLCKWPQRMMWTSDTEFTCAFEEESYDLWNYQITAFKYDLY